MKKIFFTLILILLSTQLLFADKEEFYYYNRFNPYASVYNSLSSLENPAIFGLLEDTQFSLFYQELFQLDSKYYGAALELGNVGFGISYNDNDLIDFLKYMVPVGFKAGDYMLMGVGLSLYDPIAPKYKSSWDWYAGAYFMPARFLNISVVGQNLGQPAVGDISIRRRLNLGIGIKPFSEALEMYGDFSFIEHNKEMPHRYMIAINPVKGMRLFFGINDEKDMFGGLNLDFMKFGVAFSGSYSDKESRFDGKGFAFRFSKNNYEELFTLSRQIVMVRLDNEIYDGKREDLLGIRKKGKSLIEVLNNFNAAMYDNSVAGMIVYISDLNISLAAAEEIREAILEFRKRGKKVVVFLESADDISYFIATGADRIVINEGGSLYLKGGASKNLYLKNFFEKIGVRFDVVSAGEYKTAFEPLVSEKGSEKRREQTLRLLSSLQGYVDETIADARNLKSEDLKRIYSTGLFSPQKAKIERLVDDISTIEGLTKDLKYYFGQDYGLNVNYSSLTIMKGNWQLKRRIAIIYLNGDIVYGKGFADSLGYETIGNSDILEMAEEIIKDETIAGVIVRINSPGGSTLASQLIFEALSKIKEKKPLIVSVGGMAASGGYFSAISSDYIIADNTSIVGSIGVFFLKPDISNLIKKLGINYESQKIQESGDSDSIFRGLTEVEIKNVKDYIDNFYQHFKQKVSSSRNIDISKITEIAEGKVFAGREAKSIGLVDKVGGLKEAVAKIRSLANLPADVDIEFVEFAKKRDLGSVLLNEDSLFKMFLKSIFMEKNLNEFILYRYYGE